MLTLTAAVLAFDRDIAKERLTDYRVRSQNLHIDDLEEELQKLEDAFDKLSDDLEETEVARVKARVKRLGVNNCGKKEVSCGGDHPECVHNLLVCDGIKDCHNGLDEDEKVCNADIVRVGSTFKGVTHWTSCVERDDHPSMITITHLHRSSFFGTRAWVRATITSESDGNIITAEQRSYSAKGYFVFATRQLALVPLPGSPHTFSIVCNFQYGDADHAFCQIVQQASLNVCGRLKVQRA